MDNHTYVVKAAHMEIYRKNHMFKVCAVKVKSIRKESLKERGTVCWFFESSYPAAQPDSFIPRNTDMASGQLASSQRV